MPPPVFVAGGATKHNRSIPDECTAIKHSLSILEYGVLHPVVPQLLWPLLACLLPGEMILVRTYEHASACVTGLVVHKWEPSVDVVLAYASTLPKLTKLVLEASPGRTAVAAIAAQLQQLNTFEFCRGDMTPAALSELGNLPLLEILSLARSHGVDAAAFEQFNSVCFSRGRRSRLTSLDLSVCDIDAAALFHVSQHQLLRSLTLSGCRTIDDATLRHVGDLSQLQHLDLRSCRGVTAEALAHIVGLSQLQKLSLALCERVDADALAHVGKLTELRDLNLYGCVLIGTEAVAHLTSLKNLETLSLSYCRQIDAAGFAHVARLSRLRVLILCSTSIDAAGLALLAALPRLEDLNVGGCDSINDEALACVASFCSRLRTLNTIGCKNVSNPSPNAAKAFRSQS